MSVFIRQHSAALNDAIRRLLRAPLNTLISLAAIGVVLALPTSGGLAVDNLRQLAGHAAGTQQISLFMALEATPKEIGEIEVRLRESVPERWRFVPREAALQRLKASEGLAELIDSLPKNPLPDAFIVELAEPRPEALEALAQTFSAWPRVEHVQLDTAWARRLEAFLRVGEKIVVLLGGLFALALVAATFNTIRLQIMAHAAEIEVMRAIGATDAFIRRPYQYYGALQGAAGGLFAALIVTLIVGQLRAPVGELAALYNLDFALRGLMPPEVAALAVAGALLGGLGALLSVSIHLRRGD